jgi:L-asparaginase II
MIQALPLLESGAADAAGLGPEHLALACASHNGAAIHTDRVSRWLADLSLGEAALRCGPQMPDDPQAREALTCGHVAPSQVHNNCSGKHAGFLTLGRHLGAGPEYVEPDHPVQQAARAAFEEVTGEASPRYAIDGCSAPNFATSLRGLARGMARFAAAEETDARGRAMVRLREAMMRHPDLVAGEGRSCTAMMRAMGGRAAVKTGAEGVFVAIVPGARLGVAVKIADGATRAAECTVAAILVRLGVLAAEDPAARRYLDAPILNRRGVVTGAIRTAAALG